MKMNSVVSVFKMLKARYREQTHTRERQSVWLLGTQVCVWEPGNIKGKCSVRPRGFKVDLLGQHLCAQSTWMSKCQARERWKAL